MYDGIQGHSEILSLLETKFLSKQFSGSYLFSGPSSVGKFTIAKRLAKYLTCTGLSDNSCRCENCRLFPQVPDYFEINNRDGNINISDIDGLIDFVSLVPYKSPYRVAVIDNAHKINPTASSNLLKLLEDLKDNCLIFFISHRIEKLLPTIVSRCNPVEFGPLDTEEIIEILKSKGHDVGKIEDMQKMIPYLTVDALVNFGKYAEYVKYVPQFFKDFPKSKEDEIISAVKGIDEKQELNFFVEVMIIFLNDLLKIRYGSPDVILNVKKLDYIEELTEYWKEDVCNYALDRLRSVHISINRNLNLKLYQFIIPVISWVYYFMKKGNSENAANK